MSPYNLDTAIQGLIRNALPANVPVYKADYVAPPDLQKTNDGYVYWNVDALEPSHTTEGLSGTNGEVVTFMLDVACVSNDNTKRKSLVNAVLNVLQPMVNSRRTQLTAYVAPTINVRVHYLRLLSTEEISSPKTGLSTPDMTMLLMTFSGKATC